MQARQRQVSGDREAVVLTGDDVIDRKGDRVEDLRHEAVLAGASGASPHEFDERVIHECFPRTLLPCSLLERSTRLGVKNTEQTAGICVAVKFLSFRGGEGG